MIVGGDSNDADVLGSSDVRKRGKMYSPARGWTLRVMALRGSYLANGKIRALFEIHVCIRAPMPLSDVFI
jgi:hypothetical protein